MTFGVVHNSYSLARMASYKTDFLCTLSQQVLTETYFQVGVVEMLGIAAVVVLSAVVVVNDGCPVMKVLDNVFDWKMDEMEVVLLLVLC